MQSLCKNRFRLALLASCLLLPAAHAQAQDITFADMQRDPANPELNYNYAIQQMEAGDLLSAAAALERLLLVEPNRHDARLLYAAVLYRMDDLQASARELNELEGVSLSPALAADYAYYRDLVSGARQPSRFGGQLVLGVGYDDTVLGTLSDFFGFVNADSDTSWTAAGSLNFESDLSQVKDLRFVASLQGFTKQYFDFDYLSYSIIYGDAGLAGSAGRFDWSATAAARTVLVDGDQYLTATGVRGTLGRDLSAQTSAEIAVSYDDLDYDNIEVNGFQTFAETGRSGEEISGEVTLRHRYSPRLAVSASAGLVERSADQQAFEYDGWTAGLTVDREWGRGVYSDFDYAYQSRSYDLLFSEREEDLHFIRASLGAPLKLLFGGGDATLQQLEAVTIEVAIFHEQRDADAAFGAQFFEYDNTGADIRVAWGFGQ